MTAVRVAFFTDTFQEINGVALTSRQLAEFARRREYPFLCVRGAERTEERMEGTVSHLELARSGLSFELDKGLKHDPALWRLQGRVTEQRREFKPDIIHVVSPGDLSEIGVLLRAAGNCPSPFCGIPICMSSAPCVSPECSAECRRPPVPA